MHSSRSRIFGLAAALSVTAIVVPAGAADATTMDTCNAGHSCFYDNGNWTNLLWRAPACGSYNLGDSRQFNPPINDRLSSLDNNSPSVITLYDWRGSWFKLGSIPAYYKAILGGYDNMTDRIDISC